ncbi:hypothetical protein [Ruminococcus flavefaciens]|uniref:hypothetical protein n=1 Tax=Ruminococcus flavefaciens TaxID=1265 RepID=UPI001268C6B8|nr:hypothetical protein [Ruminococcus flavefaciens]
MLRLIRNNSINGSTDIGSITLAKNTDMVSLEKLRELLPHVKQLRKCHVSVLVNEHGEPILTVNGITYGTHA